MVKFALVHRKKNRLYVRFSAKNCEFCKFCEFCEFLQDDFLFIALLTLKMKRMYIVLVESRLKNNGATHGPEREFHEGSDGFHPASPTPGFPVSFPNWVFILFMALLAGYKKRIYIPL